MTYFKKELLSNPVVMEHSNLLRWESIGNDEGILATDNEAVIRSLKNLQAMRRGGLYEINAAEYEDLKKKVVPESPLKPRLGEVWVDPTPIRIARQGLEALVAGGGNPPAQAPAAPPPPPTPPPYKPPLSAATVDPKVNRPKATKHSAPKPDHK